jgi:hypothetical protein
VSNPPLACGKVWTFEGCDSVNDVHSISRTHSPQPKRPRACRRLVTNASEASVYLLARLPGDREPPLLRVLVLHADYTRTHTHKDTHANARTPRTVDNFCGDIIHDRTPSGLYPGCIPAVSNRTFHRHLVPKAWPCGGDAVSGPSPCVSSRRSVSTCAVLREHPQRHPQLNLP